MIEQRPIPELAKTAYTLLIAEFEQRVAAIGRQTTEVLGFTEADDWTIDFGRGLMLRVVEDPPAATVSPIVADAEATAAAPSPDEGAEA